MNIQKPSSPALPLAPQEYDPMYFNQFVRTLQLYFRKLDRGFQGDGLVYALVPTSGYGLPVGGVFSSSGDLRVVQSGEAYPASSSAAFSVGTVTVTT